MTSGLPFDDIRDLVQRLSAPHTSAGERVRRDIERIAGTLGRLEEIAVWFARATGRQPARVVRPTVALFAATHAVSSRLGVAEPIADAQRGVEAVAAGAAPVSHLCAAGNLGLNVFDLALEMPVEDITQAPALEERAAAATAAFGMEAVASGADLVCLGTVDGAGDASAMALLSALDGSEGGEWQDAGEGVQAVLTEALALHRDHSGDPLEAMRRLGGREIAALVGAILAARTQNVAVILDGLAATAAAAVLQALNPDAISHCLMADTASAPHRQAATRIGLAPLLGLGTTGSGGVAAALAAGLVKAAGEVSAGTTEVLGRAV